MIKYLYMIGISPTKTHEDTKNNFGDDCLPYSSVKKQTSELKHMRTVTEDESRSGRPKDVTTDLQVDPLFL